MALLENEKPPFPPPLEKGLVLLAVKVLMAELVVAVAVRAEPKPVNLKGAAGTANAPKRFEAAVIEAESDGKPVPKRSD